MGFRFIPPPERVLSKSLALAEAPCYNDKMVSQSAAKQFMRGRKICQSFPGVVSAACVAASCLIAVPARATGFLDDLSTWTGATPCPSTSGCVDSLGSRSYDIGGTDAVGQYTITSPIATTDTFFSFGYSFEPSDPDLASAGYSLDGLTYIPLGVAQSSSIGPLLLTSGNSFSFRLTNSGELPLLAVSNFNTTNEVPAPLTALGAVAAFRASRRLRARTLRLRYALAEQDSSPLQ